MGEIASHPREAIVGIWKHGEDSFVGSAVFIAPQRLITARHVVDDAGSPLRLRLIAGQDRITVQAGQVTRHPDLDIAVISTEVAYPDQKHLLLDFRTHQLDGQSADFHAINGLGSTAARESRQKKSVGKFVEGKSGYLCDHQVPKGFSGGGVTRESPYLAAVIVERHQSEQQTVIIPLHLIQDWLQGFVPESLWAQARIPDRTSATEPGQRAPSAAFASEMRVQLRKLFGKTAAKELAAELVRLSADDGRSEAAPECCLIPENGRVELEKVLDLLHRAANQVLEIQGEVSSSDRRRATAETAREAFFLAVVLAVDEARLEQACIGERRHAAADYVEIPKSTEVGEEVTVARIGRRRADLELAGDRVKLVSKQRLAPGDLEMGLMAPDAVKEVKRLIWHKLLKSAPPESEDWQSQLAETLKLRSQRKQETCYIAIPRETVDGTGRNQSLFRELKKDLPELNAFLIGTRETGSVLALGESTLIAYIREFLLMLENYL